MRRALWLVGLLLLAAACTREPGISPGDGNSDPAGASRNPVMSMERLQELALELPDDFSDGLSTRSARKMIREVVPVTDFIDGSLLEPFAASVAASGTKAAATRAGGVAPANASLAPFLPRRMSPRRWGVSMWSITRTTRASRSCRRPGNCPRYWGMPTAATSPTR